MRRSVARGRVFPQYFSTDRRYGRLSLKACALFPLMWVNADDQGRLPGDPEEIKYATCPNIDHITKADIPPLLEELDKNKLIKFYQTSKTQAIQMLDWWQVQRLQWAWPSEYPPMEGWQDHLRYKKSAKEVVTKNWPVSGEHQNGSQAVNQVSAKKSSGEPQEPPLLTTPFEKERGKRRGRGKSPERSGERPSSSSAAYCSDFNAIFDEILKNFRTQWGRVPKEKAAGASPVKDSDIIPREPTPREVAQIRDLARALAAAGGCPLDYLREVFREAAAYGKEKKKISYLKAILANWLDRPELRAKQRAPP